MESALDVLGGTRGARELTTQRQVELVARLRELILRRYGAGSGAALAAVELAVAIQATVPDTADNVFWDSGGHALPYAYLTAADGAEPAIPAGAPGRAISSAVGRAVVRTLRKDPTPMVAVIDSMGLSTGLAFEAVNHAGHLQLPLVVVLVDNLSARGRSAGAITRYLTRVRGHPRYADAKILIEQALSRMPAGEQALEFARRLKNSIRELLIPTELWEELLGFMYLGPVEGHNLGALGDMLALALQVHRPVLVHVATEHGRGLIPEAARATALKPEPAALWTKTFATAVGELAASDERVAVISAGPQARAALARVADQTPERFFDVALGEAHAVTFAASLASSGMRPIVAIGASRLAAALAPVVAECSSNPVPVTLAVYPDEPIRRRDPPDLRVAGAGDGLDVLVPACLDDVPSLLRRAGRTGRWTLLRLPAGQPPQGDARLCPLSEGCRIRQSAESELALIAIGPAVAAAFEAAEQLDVWAFGVTDLAAAPGGQVPDQVRAWRLVVDPEFGPALARAWPRELDAATSPIHLPPTGTQDDWVQAIVSAARAGN